VATRGNASQFHCALTAVKTGGQAASRCFIKEKFSLKILHMAVVTSMKSSMDSENLESNLDKSFKSFTIETVW
jgi:hypothetical protein